MTPSLRFSSWPASPSPPHSSPTRRSSDLHPSRRRVEQLERLLCRLAATDVPVVQPGPQGGGVHAAGLRSEEHTSELQSRGHLVCRLLLGKQNPVRRNRRWGARGGPRPTAG